MQKRLEIGQGVKYLDEKIQGGAGLPRLPCQFKD